MAQTTITYTQAVEQWAAERELLRYVEPFTARKAKQKALLFAPWIGEKLLDEVSHRDVSQALIALRVSGGRLGKGLSSATLRAAHLAGSQAFSWAVSQGFACDNPFDQVKRPKANYRQARYLTRAQASALASTMADIALASKAEGLENRSAFALAVCIALATGMRRGEIFALRWEDVDFARDRIAVSKAIKADGRLGAPKSLSSIRSVAIGSGLAKTLTAVKAASSATGSDLVIGAANAEKASLNAFGHWWRRWADANGYEGLRFHELRHTHATLLIASGTDVKTVQMRLGHASAEITMSCYAHAIPLADTAAAANLDAALFG